MSVRRLALVVVAVVAVGIGCATPSAPDVRPCDAATSERVSRERAEAECAAAGCFYPSHSLVDGHHYVLTVKGSPQSGAMDVILPDGRPAVLEFDRMSHGFMFGRVVADGGPVAVFVENPLITDARIVASRSVLRGRVTGADGAHFVVSLGSADGVAAGDEFVTFRDSSYVATLRATSVRDATTLTEPVGGMTKSKIRLDDEVALGW